MVSDVEAAWKEIDTRRCSQKWSKEMVHTKAPIVGRPCGSHSHHNQGDLEGLSVYRIPEAKDEVLKLKGHSMACNCSHIDMITMASQHGKNSVWTGTIYMS